jgi:hypothetical protein
LLVEEVELNIELKTQLILEMEVLVEERQERHLVLDQAEQLTLVVVVVQVEEPLQMVEVEEVEW